MSADHAFVQHVLCVVAVFTEFSISKLVFAIIGLHKEVNY